MVGLVVLTAGAIVLVAYREIEHAMLPRQLNQLEVRLDLVAARLEDSVASTRGDVIGFRSAVALDAIVRASLAGGVDPADGTPLDLWRQRFATRFAAELAAKPLYSQFRVIGIADGGREIVRVDRSGPGGSVRIVPDVELQRQGDRDYFQQTIRLRDGEVYVSPVDLDREGGVPGAPSVPTLRVATPVYAPNGKPFGIVVFNVDLRPSFEKIRDVARSSSSIFVVNQEGDYLLHPDPSREFGFDLGKRFRIQDDFPALAGTFSRPDVEPAVVTDRPGERFAVAATTVPLAGGPLVSLIQTAQYSTLLASSRAVRDASLYAGAGAVLLAILFAAFLGRSLVRPLRRMTAAVEGFGQGEPFVAPPGVNGEIGVLARAFERTTGAMTDQAAALRRSSETFDIIMAHVVDPVVLMNESGGLVYANPAAATVLGVQFAPGSQRWREVSQAFRPDGTPLSQEERPMSRALRGENIDNFELLTKFADGRSAEFVVSGRPIRDEAGAPKGAVLIFHDLTGLKDTERQLHHSQKMESIGQLTGGVAHDFNNILTVVIGAVEMLGEQLADRPQLSALAKSIDDAAVRGAGLTRQLLAFARRQPLEPRETDVNTLVAESLTLFRPTLGEQIEIEAMLKPEAWPAMIDPSQLSTALLNLAVNARDAMPDGGKLTLETGNVILDEAYASANVEVTPGPYVMIAVSDTGTGIPAALLDKVFEPFFTTKEVGKGTGLGLSMVFGFVKQSGGHIKIYSEAGVGTTVKLYLPRIGERSEEAMQEATSETPPQGHETILVVEDDEMVRGFVVAQLASLGYTTREARDGAEALALADSGTSFDMLFTDVIMPGGMNGRQLAQEMRKRRPDIRVLYTSGYTENAIVHHGRLDPGISMLNKPYRKVELARKVREILNAPPGLV